MHFTEETTADLDAGNYMAMPVDFDDDDDDEEPVVVHKKSKKKTKKWYSTNLVKNL